MKTPFLDFFKSAIPESQKRRLLEIIKGRFEDKTNITIDDVERELDKLVEQMQSPVGTKQFQPRIPSNGKMKARSSDYNKMMQELALDLNSLYEEYNLINETQKTHMNLLDLEQEDMIDAILELRGRIDKAKIIADNTYDCNECLIWGFEKQNDGETFTNISLTKSGDLTLKPARQTEKLYSMMTRTDVKLYGSGMVAELDEAHTETTSTSKFLDNPSGSADTAKAGSVSFAFDGSDETFWGSMVLAEGPISQIWNSTTQKGIIARVRGMYQNAVSINEIRIKPFGEYVTSVLLIRYRTRHSTEEDYGWTTIFDYDGNAVTGSDRFDFTMRFPQVEIRDIEITFNVIDGHANRYLVKDESINDMSIWKSIVNKEYEATLNDLGTNDNTEYSSIEDVSLYNITGYRQYLNNVKDWERRLAKIEVSNREWKNSMMHDVAQIGGLVGGFLLGQAAAPFFAMTGFQSLGFYGGLMAGGYQLGHRAGLRTTPDQPDRNFVWIDKHEYVVGAYDVSCKGIEYVPDGIFTSDITQIFGNVIKVHLDTDETTPLDTTIEYDVSNVENPTEEDWNPLLPLDTVIISPIKERLDFVRNGTNFDAYTRFEITSIDSMEEDEAAFASYTQVGQRIRIAEGDFNSGAVYLLNYIPSGTPKAVDFSGTLTDITEEAHVAGTNERHYIILDKHPHLNYEGIYSGDWNTTTKINDVSGYDPIAILVDGIAADDKTDYLFGTIPTFSVTAGTSYQFYIRENRIYFNRSVTGIIKATYQTIGDKVTLRARLRRNSNTSTGTTPILDRAILRIVTERQRKVSDV